MSRGDNIADIISRGLSLESLREHELWQNGPHLLRRPVEQWPLSQSCTTQEMHVRVGVVMVADVAELPMSLFQVERYSDFFKLPEGYSHVKESGQSKVRQICGG